VNAFISIYERHTITQCSFTAMNIPSDVNKPRTYISVR